MYLEKGKSGFVLQRGEEITIKAVINPATEKAEFIVTSYQTDRGMATNNIVIDGIKLLWG